MDQKPFVALRKPRTVDRTDLPPDLAEFYCHNEGVGRESSPERVVRLCLLAEVKRIGWRDLHVLGAETNPGWENFAAWRIGISCFFDEIVYVIDAPCCNRGAILTLGIDLAGPGGTGPSEAEAELVLGSSFSNWLEHLKEVNWMEYGLANAGIDELPPAERLKVRSYYRSLNPMAPGFGK